MRKSFDELTITDDFMFCSVMRDADLCKQLLCLILPKTIGEITEITYQKAVNESVNSKSIRLDIFAGGEDGCLYNIEMQVADQRNLAKRLRYYQSLIDVSYLNKGCDYNDLPETYVIFFCTFDYLSKGLPVYSFNNMCCEDKSIILNDGVTKVIANSKAAASEKNIELKAFFEYMNGNYSNTVFIQRLEAKIQEIKKSEAKREEYMLLSTVELDAKREGKLEGKLETARNMLKDGLNIEFITKYTNLPPTEIEKLKSGRQ